MTTFMSTSARAVLGVAQVEQRLAVDDADADRGDRVAQRARAIVAALLQPARRQRQRDVAAGDRGGARAAVGLDDVAVDPDRPRSRAPSRSVTARRLRPMRRWISCVRPPTRPRVASRAMRVVLDPGSMPYSAVTQPRPVSRRNGGTASSTVAVQITRVSPSSISTEPSRCG